MFQVPPDRRAASTSRGQYRSGVRLLLQAPAVRTLQLCPAANLRLSVQPVQVRTERGVAHGANPRRLPRAIRPPHRRLPSLRDQPGPHVGAPAVGVPAVGAPTVLGKILLRKTTSFFEIGLKMGPALGEGAGAGGTDSNQSSKKAEGFK